MEDSFSELEKRRILAILGDNNDLITMSIAKIYTTNKNNKNWLYSGLEGFICFILDFREKRKYFILYDLNNFELLFKFELYTKFENFYKILSNNFHCFETDKGFIAINFTNKEEAIIFEKCVKKYDDTLTDQFFKKNINRRKDKYKKGREFLSYLKNKFCEELENKNNSSENNWNNQMFNLNEKIKILDFEEFDNSINDIEIFKPRFYEMMLKISYDKEKKLFNLQNIPYNMKIMFKKLGIKKSDFKNEHLAINIFKFFMKFFDELQNNKKIKIQNLEKIGNKKLSVINENPEELFQTLQKLSEKEINNLNKKPIPMPPKIAVKVPLINKNVSNSINDETKQKDRVMSVISNKSDMSKSSSEANDSTNMNDSMRDSVMTKNSLFEELKKGGMKLKKIDNVTINNERQVPFKKDEEKILQNSLMEAIKLRRMELTKNDVESDGSDSNWSD